MNAPKALIGLSSTEAGCHLFSDVVENSPPPSKAFEDALERLWRKFSNTSGPSIGAALLWPETEARTYVLQTLLPTVNPESETESYLYMNAIRHLDQKRDFSREIAWGDPQYGLYNDGHNYMFCFNRREAMVDSLNSPHVPQGSVLHQYLMHPLQPGYGNTSTSLFSIEGSGYSGAFGRFDRATARTHPVASPVAAALTACFGNLSPFADNDVTQTAILTRARLFDAYVQRATL